MALNFLTSSSDNFVETATIGGFGYAQNVNNFDDTFTEAYNTMLGKGIDIRTDIAEIAKHPKINETYKELLTSQLVNECEEMKCDMDTEYGTHQFFAEQVSDMWDNAIADYVKESAVSTLLPIKTLDLPVLIKQQLKLAEFGVIVYSMICETDELIVPGKRHREYKSYPISV